MESPNGNASFALATDGCGGGAMTLLLQGFSWIFLPAHWMSTAGLPSIMVRLVEHFAYTGAALFAAAVIAIPLGFAIGHTGRGRTVAIVIAGAARALPTLGLLSLFILLLGIGFISPVIVLAILAIPPLLAGAYAGLESVDRQTIDAARAMGMTEWQILFTVEIPLSMPLLLGGIRASVLQIIATATVAAYFAGGGLGRYVFGGLQSGDYPQMVAGSILVTAMALVVDGVLALVQKFSVPPGASLGTIRNEGRTHARANRSATRVRIPIQEGN
jgi:osmoprotectant transport system permease protein